jgi:hypothetical protein
MFTKLILFPTCVTPTSTVSVILGCVWWHRYVYRYIERRCETPRNCASYLAGNRFRSRPGERLCCFRGFSQYSQVKGGIVRQSRPQSLPSMNFSFHYLLIASLTWPVLTHWSRALLEKPLVAQVHYRVHNSPPQAPILCQMNLVRTSPILLFSLLSLFKKVYLWDHHAVCVSVYPPY